jgi:NADPH2:quinone reductase
MGGRRHVVRLERFGEPGVMRWVEEDASEPGPGEVSVAVDAIGVNFADTMVRRGEYRRDQPLDFTPGFEAAGRVLADPSGRLAAGTPVAVFAEHGGGYATQLCAPADRVYPISRDVPATAVAAIFLQGVTTLYAVDRYGRVGPGDTVLVHAAAGGVGALSTQLCASMGASVIATASSEVKRQVAARHGAAHTLPSEPDGFTAQVRELTSGRGCDVVLDGVGGPVFAPSLKALAFGGRYVVVGSASQQPAMLDARALMPRGQTVAGFVVARVAEQDPGEPQRALDRVVDMQAEGRLRPEVSVLAPTDLARAHELIESRRLTGKIVLDTSGFGD